MFQILIVNFQIEWWNYKLRTEIRKRHCQSILYLYVIRPSTIKRHLDKFFNRVKNNFIDFLVDRFHEEISFVSIESKIKRSKLLDLSKFHQRVTTF